MPFLDVAFKDLITPITVALATLLTYYLLSRKERSLKAWVTSSMQLEIQEGKNWAETYVEKQKEVMASQLVELKGELSTWSAGQIEALRMWLMESLPAIAEKLVSEPINTVLKSQSMSFLGKASGAARGLTAIENGIAEDVLPEDMKFLRDQIIKRFPSLKKTIKNPGQILELANRFGINLSDFTGSKDSNTESSSRW